VRLGFADTGGHYQIFYGILCLNIPNLLVHFMKFWLGVALLSSLLGAASCANNDKSKANPDLIQRTLLKSSLPTQADRPVASAQPFVGDGVITFSFNAFGDAGWANSHVSKPPYQQGFKTAYQRFDPQKRLIADLNYINWETSVGNVCNSFWSPPSNSTYAFLTRPEELADAVDIGFNIVGLANNHSYDCLKSPEGNGPLQSYSHIAKLKQNLLSRNAAALFSGVFLLPDSESPALVMPIRNKQVPTRLLSAFVGGDEAHCRHMVCDKSIERYAASMASYGGLRILALHSWDPSSHQKLKVILRSWLSRGLVDVAIGTGPHVAEDVNVIKTPRGYGILATSLGNFIHPSLASQPNNVVLQTTWSFDKIRQRLRLDTAKTTKVSCDGEVCRQGLTRIYVVPTSNAPL